MSTEIRSREMIERLIAFDTTSRNSNLELIDSVRGYLAGFGIDSRLTHDESETKANLYATLGPEGKSGIMLSGHTDVVPVDGQDWTTDPWRIHEADGLLYGRGTSDMKSFIAIVLSYVPEMLERGLETPIHLAFSHDEEIGCVGVHGLIRDFANLPVKPYACIVGEPTEMRVVAAHKGKRSYACHVRGHECHSSLVHTGVNAVEVAAEIVAHMRSMARRFRDEGPHDSDYEPPYTSVHTGTIEGGTALNIVPKDCRFQFEWRFLPEHDPEAIFAEVADLARSLEPEMQAIAPDTGISFVELSSIAGLNTDPGEDVVALVRALTGDNDTGKVSFGTEAGAFQQAEIPTVVCGPGSVEQAHKPNEFIAIEQVRQCEAFMDRLLERVCRPD
ncbi:MAG: acetylornithine deacetylase [Alphaproteobacteria bacterium]|nr:acetylornithine deacetylase [Alphaproteobacteria bacterium]